MTFSERYTSSILKKPVETYKLYDATLSSRLLLGTALYPSPQVMSDAINKSQTEVITVSLRRENARGKAGEGFREILRNLQVKILPNTAGCRSAREAITTARMAREIFDTPWIKLEVIANDDTLQPDLVGLIEATDELSKDGFQIFPYTTEDLSVAERLHRLGCRVLMPWGAPIGTGRGLANPYALKIMRNYFPDLTLIIDAGIGAPSHAAQAMEIGFDACLINTAVAKAGNPARMAEAFSHAIMGGRSAFESGLMEMRDMASPSSPVAGTPFFDLSKKA